MNNPRRHGGAVKRMMAQRDSFDIEKWDPARLTYRGKYFTIVCVLNIILNAISLLIVILMYLSGNTSKHAGFNVFILTLIYSASLVSLIYMWKMYKWAVISYLTFSAFGSLILATSSIFLGIHSLIHVGIVGFAAYSRWSPKYIPIHIKEKFNIE